MPYYGFRLDQINSIYQRGKIMDSDIVTFAVTVNNEEHGAIVGRFNMSSGAQVPADVVTPDIPGKFGANLGGWVVGPIFVQDGDLVNLKYSGVNVSDSPPASDDEVAKYELPLLGAMYGAAAGELFGGIASAAAGLAGGFTGIVEKLLGYPNPSCNGVVFVDVLTYSAEALSRVAYGDSMGLFSACAFTKSYDDSATHDTSQCGHIAQTEITYSILNFGDLSMKGLRPYMWPRNSLAKGLRQFAPGQNTSMRSLVCT